MSKENKDEELIQLVDGPLDVSSRKIAKLTLNGDAEQLSVLSRLLSFRAGGLMEKHAIPHLVCLAMLQHGPKGIQALMEALKTAPGSIYPTNIIKAIFYASEGQIPPSIMNISPVPEDLLRPLQKETVSQAKSALEDLVRESLIGREVFDRLITFFYQNSLLVYEDNPASDRFRATLFHLFADASIKLSRPLIAEFENLIDAQVREEEYQQFLSAHPVFLDPLAGTMIPKQKLGSEFVTDFVLRRLDDEYRAVEIEKPQDSIFSKASDFSSEFFHAIGQVIDFQSWLSKNIAYARELMPGIKNPTRGVVIIGLRKNLSERESHKLYTYSHGHDLVDVLTYDDLLDRARNLYSNLVSHTKWNS